MREKEELRKGIWKKYDALPSNCREEFSREITRLFCKFPLFQTANALLIYVSKPPEVDTVSLIHAAWKQGKIVAVPRCEGHTLAFYSVKSTEDLLPGRFGILEPRLGCKRLQEMEQTVCVVPALAFTEQGDRLGRGGGFYDRFLKEYPGVTVGFTYAALLQPEIALEAHDQKVHYLATEKGIIPTEK